jgi:phosphoribosylglycinamide formyltransferase-1
MTALIAAACNPKFPAEVALVLSDNPSAAGLVVARQAGVTAKALDFQSFPGRDAFEAELQNQLVAAHIELVCLAGFMCILSAKFVEPWSGRILNIHPSLLPDLRGLHTHERALAEARREHGCTVHYVTAHLDAGPIIAQARVPVLPGDDVGALAARVLVEEHRIYPEALDAVARALRGGQTPGP